MAVLYNAGGRPEPPTDVVARLKAISPLLEMQYVGIPVAGELRWWWTVRGQWRADDPRWQSVRDGTLTPDHAYDLVCQLPSDCSADEAVGYLQQQVQGRGDDTRKFLRDIDTWNTRQQRAVITEGGDQMEQLVKDHITEVANVTKVYQTETRRRKRAK